MRVLLLPVLLAAAVAGSEVKDTPTEKPAQSFDATKHPWARFGVGSFAVAKHKVFVGPGLKNEQTATAELTEIKDGVCTVTIYEGEGDKKKKAGSMRYALLAPECIMVDANPKGNPFHGGDPEEAKESVKPPKAVGQETIEAAGKQYACTIYEMEESDGMVKQTAVTAEGLRVRTVTGMKNDQGKIEEPLVELLTKADTVLSGGGKKLRCQIYAREDKDLGEKTVTWFSLDIPGGVVRSETVSKDESGTEVRDTFEVVEWKAVERK